MIGIIGAMEVEVSLLKDALKNKKTETVSGIDFVSGELFGVPAVVAKCGVGKVFAALCTQTMILKYEPQCVINVGVGGALDERLDCLDVALASSLVQHDMDTSPLGDPVGLISGINIVNIPTDKELTDRLEKAVKTTLPNCIRGVIASGDVFVADAERKSYIKETFNAVVCEMEGAAIAHVCYVNNTPVAVLRAVSDRADGGATKDFPTFVKEASDNTVKVIKAFCENLKK